MGHLTVRSRAPLRLGLAGGGSDVSPYSDLYGGCVLNATINMYAYCTLEQRDDGRVEFVAADMGENWSGEVRRELDVEGSLLLHKAVYNRIVREYCDGQPLSIRVVTHSDAPPGSGLGSSSTMVVTILRAYQELLKLPLGEYDLARLAYEIERIDCKLAGGKQDQYAATFGGFNFMEFYRNDRVIVNPLRIRREVVNEIESGMLLYYTGQSRDSAEIIDEQMRTVSSGEQYYVDLMHDMKQSAVDMKEALLTADVTGMATILGKSWLSKREVAHSISNSRIDNFIESAMEAGAVSAKISGAGGGGYLMLFVQPTSKVAVQTALSRYNGTFYRFNFTEGGAEGWMV